MTSLRSLVATEHVYERRGGGRWLEAIAANASATNSRQPRPVLPMEVAHHRGSPAHRAHGTRRSLTATSFPTPRQCPSACPSLATTSGVAEGSRATDYLVARRNAPAQAIPRPPGLRAAKPPRSGSCRPGRGTPPGPDVEWHPTPSARRSETERCHLGQPFDGPAPVRSAGLKKTAAAQSLWSTFSSGPQSR